MMRLGLMVRQGLRPFCALLLLGLLAACADMPRPGTMPVTEEAADYRAHARRYYAPPGPPEDPWGPYIREASRRFDVPDRWIRSVMHQESGGHEFINGRFVTSAPGAMGLMQLMPPTYDDLRVQYRLGSDPYEPHDNITAGTAYIRQMYDIYGSPGFLAAYDTGPGRLDDFLTRNRSLPHETRQYVAIIGQQIAGIYPAGRSQADLLVMNQKARAETPAENRSVRVAWARRRNHTADTDQPEQVAEAPRFSRASYRVAWHPTSRVAPLPRPQRWAIQVGAFGTRGQATHALGSAQSRVHVLLPHAQPEIAGVRSGRAGAHLYRARLTRLSRDAAMQACQRLNRGRAQCRVIGPDSRT